MNFLDRYVSAIDKNSNESEIKQGSPRSFGIVFTVILLVVGLWPVVFSHLQPRWWVLGMALLLLAVSMVKPSLLQPLNKLWFRFGMMLSRIINPLVMCAIFVVAVIPTGLIMRALGKRPLRLKQSAEGSLWVNVEDEDRSFKDQF